MIDVLDIMLFFSKTAESFGSLPPPKLRFDRNFSDTGLDFASQRIFLRKTNNALFRLSEGHSAAQIYVSAAFFKTAGMRQCRALDPSLDIVTMYLRT